jgi:iron complex outermembrane recepter protein
MVATFIPSLVFSQNACRLGFNGNVFDAKTHEPLPGAVLFIQETNKGYQANSKGFISVAGLCAGKYTILTSFVGYKTDTLFLEVRKNRALNFSLEQIIETIGEVEVTGKREDDKPLVSQIRDDVRGEDLVRVRGATLGEALSGVPGVYTLQTGPTIFKPVIHGLHSNRILILNNGVRQEGQQWGSEHAPEVDPFVATKLSIVKGPSSIRYGSDAIGGVILVEPSAMSSISKTSGEVNLVGATNNRMGVVSGILQSSSGNGWSWRAQGTLRRGGNVKTPHYYLENTGFDEANFSAAVSFLRPDYGVETYYSEFNTTLGIFTGTVAESVSDLEAAINRPQPITPSYFSYAIGRPYQHVKHDLIKANAYKVFRNQSRIDAVFARQENVRSEYDYVPLNGSQNPELYLRLISHTVDAVYKMKSVRRYSASTGINGITQGNVREYEVLIPNFRNYGAGAFYIGQWSNDRLTLEGGARYDYRWLRAYMLDNNTAQVVTPTWVFHNFTGTLGSQYYLRENLSWVVNASTAWRAPTVNELESQGVHQSAVAYEIGNPDLHSERAYTASTGIRYQTNRLQAELGLYNNLIDGYIFLKPDLQFIHTVRGSYPTYTYTQVNARFRGVDLSANVRLTDSLSLISKTSLLYAWNQTIHDYLQLVPANRFENGFRYGIRSHGRIRNFYVAMSGIYVAHQYRVPPNSDYLPPPPAYTLLQANLGISIPLGKQQVGFSLTCTNLLNVAYRDYMDRFRYFNDEPGRNFTLRIRIPI